MRSLATQVKPTALIGVSTVAGAFTTEVLQVGFTDASPQHTSLLEPQPYLHARTTVRLFMMFLWQAMAALNERPIIMPLSNPTSKSECTFEAAVAAAGSRVLFASGSPFPPCTAGARTLFPAQANK
jgi:malic enzyme